MIIPHEADFDKKMREYLARLSVDEKNEWDALFSAAMQHADECKSVAEMDAKYQYFDSMAEKYARLAKMASFLASRRHGRAADRFLDAHAKPNQRYLRWDMKDWSDPV